MPYPDWAARSGEGGARTPVVPVGPGGPGATAPPGAAEASDPLSGIAKFLAFGTDVISLIMESPEAAKYIAFIADVPIDKLAKGLDVAGGLLTAIVQYRESTATTVPGKLVDAAGAGAIDIGLGAIHPALPVIDAAVGFIAEEAFGVKGLSISDTLNTSVRATVTVVEGIITWDERGMEDFHTKSMSGEYGPVFQAASEAGEFWAEHGIIGGLEEFGSAVADLFDW